MIRRTQLRPFLFVIVVDQHSGHHRTVGEHRVLHGVNRTGNRRVHWRGNKASRLADLLSDFHMIPGGNQRFRGRADVLLQGNVHPRRRFKRTDGIQTVDSLPVGSFLRMDAAGKKFFFEHGQEPPFRVFHLLIELYHIQTI